MGPQLTMVNLLKAVAIGPEEIESWRHRDASHSGMNGSNPELGSPLPPPPQTVTHLEISVRLNPPPQTVAHNESTALEIPLAMWQELEIHWKAIVSLEANVDTLRINMESLLVEMEASLTKTLTVEEKTHALRADVAQWNKVKNRVRFALPRMRDFIHRSIWALGAPERKRLKQLYKEHIQPQIPFANIPLVLKQLESLQKSRQVLSGQGLTVYQVSKNISAEVQRAFKTLQTNAATNARRKMGEVRSKGKFFKDIRRWTGA
jgi:hypothetical protein